MVSGTFVSGNASSITFTKADGTSATHSMKSGYTVTLDGAASKIDKLQAGDEIEITGDPGTSVAATRD